LSIQQLAILLFVRALKGVVTRLLFVAEDGSSAAKL